VLLQEFLRNQEERIVIQLHVLKSGEIHKMQGE